MLGGLVLLLLALFLLPAVRPAQQPPRPQSLTQSTSANLRRPLLQSVSLATLAFSSLVVPSRRVRADDVTDSSDDDSVLYLDKPHRFALSLLPGWTKFPGKSSPGGMMQYQTEESFLVSNNFQEGASMSVTRTNAARLLKDFEIEWWFAPLNSIGDLGSADLIAELLILQRQGDFEKKTTPSQILAAKINGNELEFEFDTPLAEAVNRRTLTKAVFRPATASSPPSLDCIWISALVSVMEGDYRSKLERMKKSFRLL